MKARSAARLPVATISATPRNPTTSDHAGSEVSQTMKTMLTIEGLPVGGPAQ